MQETISLIEILISPTRTYSVKDNSVRGYITKDKDSIRIGDEVILKNHFVLVIE